MRDVFSRKPLFRFREKSFVRFLKLRRCNMVEDMHECQRKIDRIDYLIRQTKNNNHRKED